MTGGEKLALALAATAGLVTAGALLLMASRKQNERLRAELEHLREVRDAERTGRTRAERRLRTELETSSSSSSSSTASSSSGSPALAAAAAASGAGSGGVVAGPDPDEHRMYAVGQLRSVFASRNGCPWQGQVSVLARSKLKLRSELTADILDGLSGFSHVWVLFVFHDNTNNTRLKTESRSQQKKQQQQQQRRFKGLRVKITPPRLGGKKVGIFATRTPHRPNAIGLSVARLERVDRGTGTLHFSGLDLIDGTPILDIKPYIPRFDSVGGAAVPAEVIADASINDLGSVSFTSEAREQLAALVDAMTLYGTAEEAEAFVVDTLRMDVRSLSKKARARTAGAGSSDAHHVVLDNLRFDFEVRESPRGDGGDAGGGVRVMRVTRAPRRRD